MQLSAKALLEELEETLKEGRLGLKTAPGLALVWIGDDQKTAAFIRAKQNLAKKLNCRFPLHHFPVIDEPHLAALIGSLNINRDVHGIVLQLPLPRRINADRMINLISPAKDVDGLTDNSPFPAPTPRGIMTLLSYNKIVIKGLKTVILGAGRLVGKPLAEEFKKHGWPFDQIEHDAEHQAEFIRQHDLLIASTGVKNLITAMMVHKDMIVIDGSGVDVDVLQIEPRVKAITPPRGAVGPLTVRFLFVNLLRAAGAAT